MSQQDDLRRAVCDNPADDTARLVYADCLEENGHSEQAAYIRVEVELQQSGPGRGPPRTAEDQRALGERLLAARAAYDPEANADANLNGLRPEWSRGFVGCITIEIADCLGRLEAVLAIHPIEMICLLNGGREAGSIRITRGGLRANTLFELAIASATTGDLEQNEWGTELIPEDMSRLVAGERIFRKWSNRDEMIRGVGAWLVSQAH